MGTQIANTDEGLVSYRPGENADLASADALQGGPVFKKPSETPDDYLFVIGLAGQGLRCMGVLENAVKYGRDTSKIINGGVCEARVKAAATAIPGAYLAPEGGATHHFYVSASPTPFRLITDLSGQTVGTIYGPAQPTSAGTIPKIKIEHKTNIESAIRWNSPDVLDADGYSVAAAVAGAGNLTLGGALTSGGVGTPDVPRNVTILSAGNDSGITFTVTGTNILDQAISEAITGANAGTATGAVAFKTVTQIAASGAAAGNVSAGTGDKLGLPDAAAVRLVEATILNGAVEGTAATLAKDADEIEKNTIDLNSALNATQVDVLLYER